MQITSTTQNNFIKHLFLFILGGFTYFYMEIAFRGYSHYSMILCAGLAFILCGSLRKLFKNKISFVSQMILSCLIITILEFITGYIVNIRFQMNVWDYSNLPYNFMGQVCLFYSLLWLCLSILCILIYDITCHFIFDEVMPHYHIL